MLLTTYESLWRNLIKYYLVCFGLSLCLLLSGCNMENISHKLDRFMVLSGSLTSLVTGVAYLMGLAFAYKGIIALKLYGDSRTMMSNNASLKAPLLYLLVAAVFMYLPTAIKVVNSSIFGAENPLANITGSYGNKGKYLTGLFYFIRFIGLVSFVRGWLYLAALGQQGQHHSMGKAVTHIIGGVLAINIQATADFLNPNT